MGARVISALSVIPGLESRARAYVVCAEARAGVNAKLYHVGIDS